MAFRKTCIYCGHAFTAYQRRQKVCRKEACRRQRALENKWRRYAYLSEHDPAGLEELRERNRFCVRRYYLEKKEAF